MELIWGWREGENFFPSGLDRWNHIDLTGEYFLHIASARPPWGPVAVVYSG
jgi:hypothetical protein